MSWKIRQWPEEAIVSMDLFFFFSLSLGNIKAYLQVNGNGSSWKKLTLQKREGKLQEQNPWVD